MTVQKFFNMPSRRPAGRHSTPRPARGRPGVGARQPREGQLLRNPQARSCSCSSGPWARRQQPQGPQHLPRAQLSAAGITAHWQGAAAAARLEHAKVPTSPESHSNRPPCRPASVPVEVREGVRAAAAERGGRFRRARRARYSCRIPQTPGSMPGGQLCKPRTRVPTAGITAGPVWHGATAAARLERATPPSSHLTCPPERSGSTVRWPPRLPPACSQAARITAVAGWQGRPVRRA